MACGLVTSNLNLQPGEGLRVRGEVAPNTKSFVLNLGNDSNNLCLHFNLRFDIHGDTNTIVCSSKDGGARGTEQWESAFPFQPGSVTELCISFDQ
ncbi:Galectin-1 [Pteropus alecto]|uniref:Galectin n=1 Tax=Pteropus alecto TaxID=9402 RepID=L5KG57_PTEAL|nr:Galectin-1 [Pteropus alecto]